jgi:hypothetical protein
MYRLGYGPVDPNRVQKKKLKIQEKKKDDKIKIGTSRTSNLQWFVLVLSQLYIPSECGTGFFMIRVRIRGSVKV